MTPNDVKIVADNIGDFIEVPDGIERLRKAILTLAVAGKLAPQDKKEDCATELFAQTQAESRNKKTKITSLEKAPFDIPSSWKWVRLGDLGRTETGSTPKQTGKRFDGGTLPFVRPDNIKSLFISEARDRLTEADLKNGGTLMPGGSLLMVCIGSIGKVGVAYQDVSFNQQINAITPHGSVLVEYLLYASASGYFQEFAWKLSSKTTLPILNKSKWESIPIPLPPFAEQKRIVKKIEEVMEQLDELERQKIERDAVRARLARSAMQALEQGEKALAFQIMPELIKTLEDVTALEQAVLTLAVSGKLVTQDSKDGTGAQLHEQLHQIQRGAAKGRSAKVYAPVHAGEVTLNIPKSWKWIRFGEAFADYGSGSTPSRSNSDYYGGSMNWYKSGELTDGPLIADAEEKVSDLALEECRLRMNHPGDLLIAMYGATAGKLSIMRNEGVTNQAVWGGTPKSQVDVEYLFLYMLQSRATLIAMGAGAAQPNISGEKIINHPLPLPPLQEQRRIVKAVASLRKELFKLDMLLLI